ncbi:MAG TPA: hypothetical protein VFE37_30390 [Chloroflexota bacterium]|nr:hypothetical protein [Chloroflexota bacterium]
MLTTATPVAFDGRDVSDATIPDEVIGYGLLTCPCCGTLRDARYPYCCEFAADAALQPLLLAR